MFFVVRRDARGRRHRGMAEYTQEWAREHFEMSPRGGYLPQTVTCIEHT